MTTTKTDADTERSPVHLLQRARRRNGDPGLGSLPYQGDERSAR
jgi:hypothetical protein